MSVCRSCGQEVLWAHTETGGRMPVNRKPEPTGNLVLRRGKKDSRKIYVAVETPWRQFPNEARRWIAHFVTCPHAALHRAGTTQCKKQADESLLCEHSMPLRSCLEPCSWCGGPCSAHDAAWPTCPPPQEIDVDEQ